MRVTFVSPPLNMSGGNKVVAIYAKELADMGHAVTVVSPAYPKTSIRDKVRSLVKGDGWPLSQQSYPLNNHVELDSYRPVLNDDVPDADVVIATWWETAEWVSKFSSQKGRKFYFVQHHEVFPGLPDRSRDTYHLPLRKIVVSKWLKDIMASEYGDNNVSLVPNTVDRFQFYSQPRPKNDTATVGVLYSCVNFKGLDVSLRAIETVKNRIPNLKVVSFGSDRPIRRLPLPARSKMTVRPTSARLKKIYEECDLWLTCSRAEGFNLPALEAMASRTPVVSTKTGWPLEGVVDCVNGILVDVDDAHGAAEAMLWILGRPQREWQRLSEAAYQTMTTPSWRSSAQIFERSLQSS